MSKENIYQNPNAGAVSGWHKFNGILALSGIAGPLLLLGADLIVPLSFFNYNPIQDSISVLAWAGLGWIESATFLIAGFLLETFAAVLILGIRRARGFHAGIILLACSGFGLIMIGIFPADLPYFPTTFYGMIHGISAKAIFLLMPLAMLLISPSLKKDPYWKPLFIFSISIAALIFIWMVIYQIWSPENLGFFGLYERVLVCIEILSIEVMAFWLLRLFLRSIRNTPVETAASQRCYENDYIESNTGT